MLILNIQNIFLIIIKLLSVYFLVIKRLIVNVKNNKTLLLFLLVIGILLFI
jgi:hypothetical protein